MTMVSKVWFDAEGPAYAMPVPAVSAEGAAIAFLCTQEREGVHAVCVQHSERVDFFKMECAWIRPGELRVSRLGGEE